MPSNLEEFFAKLHWELVLPVSGLTVLLRQPDLLSLVSLGLDLPIPTVPADPAHPSEALPAPGLTVQQVNRYTERIIAEGVITPSMSDARDDQGKPIYSRTQYVHVSELAQEDRDAIATALFAKLGLTAEAATSVAAFRPDADRENAEGARTGVLDTPERYSQKM